MIIAINWLQVHVLTNLSDLFAEVLSETVPEIRAFLD